MPALRLTAILAHPDDESLGCGGTLATYAAEGVDVSLITATRGERGRFRGIAAGAAGHPGEQGLAAVRERELRAAAAVLGVRELVLLDYLDQEVDRAPVAEAVSKIAAHLRRLRPHVVLTFGPDGAYGHPDHIAVSQFATAAVVAAADGSHRAGEGGNTAPHAVSKLYYIAWNQATWAAYQAAFRWLVSNVDGVARQTAPWPDWSLTTVIDARRCWPTVWRAVSCHESQVEGYAALKTLEPAHHEALWGAQSFYRAFSLVNGGRRRESDLFEGLREMPAANVDG